MISYISLISKKPEMSDMSQRQGVCLMDFDYLYYIVGSSNITFILAIKLHPSRKYNFLTTPKHTYTNQSYR